MSGVISEFMIAAQPTLERMAYAFHQLKQDRDVDHQRVADMLLELHAERDQKNRTSLEADYIGMASSSISRSPRCTLRFRQFTPRRQRRGNPVLRQRGHRPAGKS